MTEVILKTEHKFAIDAPDCTLHMESYEDSENFSPKKLEFESGAGSDYNTDLPFIREIIERFPLEGDEKLNWLDLGCAGGHLMLDVNEQEETDVCIGLDGSVGVHKQESWSSGKNSEVLRNADIAKEYSIEYLNGEKVKFDIITCWEVLEHFYEEQLDQFFTNVYEHLSDEGVFVGSIAFFPDTRDENGYPEGHPKFNPNGKLYELHKLLWNRPTWDKLMSKWFNIINFDFDNRFRNGHPAIHYYFSATKKV